MTEMPDVIRRAMEAQGKYDPDEALAAAQTAIPPDEVDVAEQDGSWRDLMPDIAPESDLSEAERAMIQPPLFDAAASRAARDEGMARVDRAADPDWKDAAYRAMDAILARGGEFTADDVWAEVGTFPKERRALGPILRAHADAGRIVNTGRRKNSERPEHHSYPMTVWRVA